MLARFQERYSTGSLISKLLQIHEGKFVVQVEVQVDGVTRATGLAAAENLELAEDKARSRALVVLLTEPSSETQAGSTPQHFSEMSEVQPVVKPSLPSVGADKKEPSSFATTVEWNSSTSSSFAAVPTVDKPKLNPENLSKFKPENKDNSITATPWVDAEVAIEPSARMYDSQPENKEKVVLPFGNEEPADLSEYSYEENIPEPYVVAEVKKLVNMSEVFTRSSIELGRLDWNTQQGRSYLKEKYGKTSRQQLSDNELLEFLGYLESQPTPNKLPLT